MCSNFVTILGLIDIVLEGDLCDFFIAHCEWTLIIHNNLRLVPKVPVSSLGGH